MTIPGFIKKKMKVIWLSGLFTNKSSQYRNPDNRGLGFFSRLSGTFPGPSHPDNQGPNECFLLPFLLDPERIHILSYSYY